jgi:Na+/H+ antiporter NhaD/arsenite permease-like protein
LSWVAAGGGLLLLIIDWRDSSELLRRVDYSVLVVFTGLFMVVAGTVLPSSLI